MVAVVNRARTRVAALPGGRYRISKTGTEVAFDASAVSVSALAGDFVLKARSVVPSASVLIGVTADPTEDDGYTSIDHTAQLLGSALYIYQRGVFQPPVATNAGIVWIVRVGGVLTYRTGLQLGSAAVVCTETDITAPLYFDSSLYSPEAVVEVRFDPPGLWTDGGARRPARGMAFGFGAGRLSS